MFCSPRTPARFLCKAASTQAITIKLRFALSLTIDAEFRLLFVSHILLHALRYGHLLFEVTLLDGGLSPCPALRFDAMSWDVMSCLVMSPFSGREGRARGGVRLRKRSGQPGTYCTAVTTLSDCCAVSNCFSGNLHPSLLCVTVVAGGSEVSSKPTSSLKATRGRVRRKRGVFFEALVNRFSITYYSA